MSNLSITGTIHKIYDRETVSDKFTKREFVLQIQDGNYTQFAKFQMTQDRCDILDKRSEGETATVHFNLRGREYQGKYFTNLEAWKIEVSGGSSPITRNTPQNAQNEATTQNTGDELAVDENLPF